MAFLVKTGKNRTSGPSSPGFSALQAWTQVTTPSRIFPQTSTFQIFRVNGGRVLVHKLVGELSVATTTDPVMKLTHKRLDNASVAVGTAVDIGPTAALTSKEVGTTISVLSSGAAYTVNNAGANLSTLGNGAFILPQGETYMTTTASQAGQIFFDIFYQPIDPGAYVTAVIGNVVAI